MHFILRFITIAALTIGIDIIWLGFIAKKTIINLIKPYISMNDAGELIIKSHFALLSWLLIVFGVYFFVHKKLPETAHLYEHAIQGALFGAVCYGVYDFTTAAIQLEWPLQMIILDVCWGTLLCSACAIFWKLLS